MLRKPFEVMSKFLELGVGHFSRWTDEKTHGVGSILKAAVTAWRRAARRPPESRGKMSLTLETTTAEHQRFDAARDVPLLIPAWLGVAHPMIFRGRAARKSNGRSRGLKRLGRVYALAAYTPLPDLIFQSGQPDHAASRLAQTNILIRFVRSTVLCSLERERNRSLDKEKPGDRIGSRVFPLVKKPFNAFQCYKMRRVEFLFVRVYLGDRAIRDKL